MDFTSALFSILIIHLMASISPGPDFFVVSQKTLLQGKKAGVLCGIGVCTGLLVHIGYSVAGLTTATEHSGYIAQGVGVFGGSYLMFLGCKSIKGSFSKRVEIVVNEQRKNTAYSAFLSGLVVNIFNPKASIYFMSLFSVIISPTMGTERLSLIIISIIAVQMTWYLTFIYFVTIPSIRTKFDSKVYLIDRTLGILMVLMGIYMLAIYIFG